jgi:hypothetical protein
MTTTMMQRSLAQLSVGSRSMSPTMRTRNYSSQPPRGPNTAVKFWPFLAIIVVGTGAFAYVSKSMAGQG